MHRTALILVVPFAVLGLGLLALAPARAEKPMSPPAVLADTATHIVRGEVVRVFERTRRQGSYEVTHYVAEVDVEAVEKGAGIDVDRPLYARYWSQEWKGRGHPPPGTSGHAPLAEEGQTVRLYLARNAYDGFGTERKDGGYDVIGKNGIQPLTDEEARAAALESAAAPIPFPAAWKGHWTGTLRIARPGGGVEDVDMVLVVAPTDDPQRWAWRIRYGEQPLRRYTLVVQDAEAGAFAIDEGNGIVLPAALLDGELYSAFSVQGNVLVARYRLDGDHLRYHVTMSPLAPEATSGGDGVPEVGAHPVRVVQHAALTR